MRHYYERRAPEYDEWWLAPDRWRGEERPGWTNEVAELIEVVAGLAPARTLDVACGTAFLTQHLRGEVTALDQSQAMLDIAAPRLPNARLVRDDAVPLPFTDGEFERLFTGHFYGHLLAGERKAFLAEARRVAGELAAELGGGEILYAGRWFVAVVSSPLQSGADR